MPMIHSLTDQTPTGLCSCDSWAVLLNNPTDWVDCFRLVYFPSSVRGVLRPFGPKRRLPRCFIAAAVSAVRQPRHSASRTGSTFFILLPDHVMTCEQ